MTKVIGVRFRTAGKIYYFSPGKLEIEDVYKRQIIARQVVFYVAGAVAAIGIIAKLVAGISLKRLVRASSNMNKSNHALMRLVRAKFEHACMVSDKVQNVRAFVEKYVYEYRIIGLRLHSWRRLERTAIWLYALVCAFGAGAEYYVLSLIHILVL